MDNHQALRPVGPGFLCRGAGMVTAAAVSGPSPRRGVASLVGLGELLPARGRKAG